MDDKDINYNHRNGFYKGLMASYITLYILVISFSLTVYIVVGRAIISRLLS